MNKLCQTALLFFSLTTGLTFIYTIAYATEFQFPVTCQVMGNCWITNHVDLNDRIGTVEDYMCGQKATDNNASTHISLGSLIDIRANVPVIAAADGVVKEATTGYPDSITPVAGESFCGNRVLITHANGWESSYCHLKNETLQVRVGQPVKAGQPLAAIGMSGAAEWPRLSFATIRNGLVFDPFSGRTAIEGCSQDATRPLWRGSLNPPYEPAAVTNAGFTTGFLTNEQILSGTAENATVILKETPRLTMWALMMNLRQDDEISLSITTPKGRILEDIVETVTQDSIYYPIYLSTSRGGFLWDAGQYEGKITITRRVHGTRVTSGRVVPLSMQ